MPRNDSPRPVSPELATAVEESFAAMEASGFTHAQIMDEQSELLFSSIATRAGLPVDTFSERWQAGRAVGNAIGAYLLRKKDK
jgi:hypothetical protein